MNPLALIIEDTRQQREIFVKTLTSLSFDVVELEDGEQALAYNGRYPNLILLDFHLPYYSGGDILKQWQTDNKFADVPKIMLTADHISGVEWEETVDLVLLKPVSIHQLMRFARRFTA